jgi:hypothetical protein
MKTEPNSADKILRDVEAQMARAKEREFEAICRAKANAHRRRRRTDVPPELENTLAEREEYDV